MDNKLKKLFDYQKFENNKRLSEIITEAEGDSARKLTLDELDGVSAAGDPAHLIRGTGGHKQTETDITSGHN